METYLLVAYLQSSQFSHCKYTLREERCTYRFHVVSLNMQSFFSPESVLEGAKLATACLKQLCCHLGNSLVVPFTYFNWSMATEGYSSLNDLSGCFRPVPTSKCVNILLWSSNGLWGETPYAGHAWESWHSLAVRHNVSVHQWGQFSTTESQTSGHFQRPEYYWAVSFYRVMGSSTGGWKTGVM